MERTITYHPPAKSSGSWLENAAGGFLHYKEWLIIYKYVRKSNQDAESGQQRIYWIAEDNPINQTTRKRPHPPRTATVAIKIQDGKTTHAEVMMKARRSIQLNDMNSDNTRLRRDATGGLLIQISGAEARGKTLSLRDKL